WAVRFIQAFKMCEDRHISQALIILTQPEEISNLSSAATTINDKRCFDSTCLSLVHILHPDNGLSLNKYLSDIGLFQYMDTCIFGLLQQNIIKLCTLNLKRAEPAA